MLLNRPQIKIFERIIRNKKGELVLGFFAVLEWEGKYYLKLLRTEKISKDLKHIPSPYQSYVLPCITTKLLNKYFSKNQYYFDGAPYKKLLFFASQLTRAPSQK